jgi:hypothetical protein
MSVILDGTAGVTFNDASTQNTAATGFGFKNRIINGAMVIDQRNAGASVTLTTNVTYTLDRWLGYLSVASKYSMQQSTTTATPFINSLLVTSLSSYTVGAGEQFSIAQLIEGSNVYDLAWGTASAATVTLSFWVRSSLTGTFGGALRNSAGNRSYPFSYTISAANTFEQKTITIAGDTTGTWLTTNGVGIGVVFGIGVGSTLSGTAGAWAAGNLFSATGATSVVGTSGATFYITGVQLEKGSTATTFDYRPYGTELALCQRYYQICTIGWVGSTTNGNLYGGSVTYPVQPRTSTSNAWISSSGLNSFANSAGAFGGSTIYGTFYYKTANATTGSGASFSDVFSVSAEL